VRNHLLKLSGLTENIRRHLNELVHPVALGDPLQEPRHRAFIAGCLGSGAAALLILPLHLALLGPTTLPVALVLAWLLGQWPLALYLSQTGNIERAHAVSATLFASFLAGLCLFTGGLSSFALLWLAVVPMEAALSGSRRVILGTAALCLAFVAGLALAGSTMPAFELATPHAMLISALAACCYMAVLALRLALDQKRSRSVMRAGEERLRLLNEAASDVICAVEADGTARILGGAVETILGITPRQAKGDWLFQRVHVSDRPLYLTRLADARGNSGPASVELRLRKGANAPGEQGEPEYVWCALSFRQAGSGSAAGLRLTLQDISARKAQDEALRQAREDAEETSIAKTRFIASASHELRTPLNAIIGFSDMLRGGAGANGSAAQSQEYAELIHQSGLHLLQVVDDILDSSRIETGHMPLVVEPVDLADCLESCRAMMAPIADNAGVHLQFPAAGTLPVLPADRRALKQIVINLVSNAIKFSPEGGTAELSVRHDGKFLTLEVRDRGPGIPAHLIQRLGQPFVRIETQDTGRSAGSGLGLSIVKGLAELHGGGLQLESRPGQGTVASVRLPAGALKAQPALSLAAEDDTLKPGTGTARPAGDAAALAQSA
jgi:two-component system, cell cycle sensor histidine kinase DivJ